jgi:hypothetical protein
MGQGYLWSRPVELAAARELLHGSALTTPPPPAATAPAEAPPLVRHGEGDDRLVTS